MNSPIYPSLTDEQRAVVLHDSGHAKVTACPGSGKSETALYRVHYLLTNGVEPSRITVVMFNKAAKDQFNTRLKVVCSEYTKLPDVRTFHSLGLAICKRLVGTGFLDPADLVTDDGQVIAMCRDAMRSADPEPPAAVLADTATLEAFMLFVDLVKSGLSSAADMFVSARMKDDYSFFVDAFHKLEATRQRRKIRTFADLIYDPVKAMLASPAAAAQITNKFKHVVVDEYQDTSEIQQEMIKFVAGTRADVMVIGDLNQCIYAWRGAQPEFIRTGFEKDFPSVRHYNLSRTFRYGHELAIASNYVISKNDMREGALSVSAPSTPQTKIYFIGESVVRAAPAALDLPQFVKDWVAAGRRHDAIAILPRLFADAYPHELALLRAGVPYKLVGAPSILESNITQAILGFMHLSAGSLADHPRKSQLVESMLTMPPVGVRAVEIRDLINQVARDTTRAPSRLRNANQFSQSYVRSKLDKRAGLWITFTGMKDDTPAFVAIKQWERESGAAEWFEKSATAEQQDEREKVLLAWLGLVSDRSTTIRQFLDSFAQMEDAHDRMENTEDGVLITSIHRAKGSQWPVVILPGLREGNFPFIPQDRPASAADIEDERRLFFVGATRAKEQLYILHPQDDVLTNCVETGIDRAPGTQSASRFLYEMNLGVARAAARAVEGDLTPIPPSPFPQIANDYLHAAGCRVAIGHAELPKVQRDPSLSTPSSLAQDMMGPIEVDSYGVILRRGGRVNHPHFGVGTLRLFEQDGLQAVVTFPLPVGERTLSVAAAIQAGLRPI